MEFAACNMKITRPADHTVDAKIDLGPEGGAFSLAARPYVSLPGMERATAQRLVEAAQSKLAPWLLTYRDPSRWRNRPGFRKAAALPRPPISVRAIAVLVLEIPCHSCPRLKIGQKRPGFSLVKRAAWVT